METFGAWLFIIGLCLNPVIFIIGCLLNIEYKDDLDLIEIMFNIVHCSQFLCWVFIVSGMLLVYYF